MDVIFDPVAKQYDTKSLESKLADGIHKALREKKQSHLTPVSYKRYNSGACTILKFADGTEQKVVKAFEDEDDLMWALKVCLIYQYFDSKKGMHSAFKNLYKMVDNQKKVEKEELESRLIAGRRRARKARKKARRAERAKEREIEIQKEAYLRAMREYMKETSEASTM